MPCGPLQSVQIYALGTGSAFFGALSMFLFSIGTVPLMLGFGSLSSILPPKFHGRILKVSALLVLMLGGGMVLRGMSLNGLSIMGANSFNVGSENVRIAEIVEDKQYVRTIMHSGEYEPFIVQAGIPVVWTIFADEAELNGCNNPLTVPEYGIRFHMVSGENIIEFTPPAEETNITYTCWMGMITSGIKVVSDLNNIDASLLNDTAALATGSESECGSGGGCCSSGGEEGGFSSSAQDPFFQEKLPLINTDLVGMPAMVDGIQIINVTVNENGFEPSIIVLQKGLETNWMINGEFLNEQNYRITFPAYGNRGIELIEGANALQIIPEIDFPYFSWKNDFGGFVKIVEDIQTVDVDEVKAAVNAYNAQNNY
jgi:plastocyanin domain-containing protein